MKTDQFLNELKQDLKPVKRLCRPWVRLLIWLGIASIGLAFGLHHYGFRHDIGVCHLNPHFIIETIGLFAAGLLAAYGAFKVSIPGENNPRWTWIFVLPSSVLLASLVYTMIANVVASGIHAPSLLGLWCSYRITMLAIFPVIVLVAMIRRSMPLYSKWTGFLCAVSVIFLGAFVLQFICGSEDALHKLSFHMGPLIVAAFAGVGLSRFFPK